MVQRTRLTWVTGTIPLAVLLATSAASGVVEAHFPWLTRTSDGKAALFFGEGLADRTYHLPPSIAVAQIQQLHANDKPTKLTMTAVESSDFVGLKSKEDVNADTLLYTQATFGVYHGSKLMYYALHQGGKLPTSRPTATNTGSDPGLLAEIIDTDSGVDVYVTWQGEPLAEAEVHLFCAEGHEEGLAKTDATGKVAFTDGQVEEGLNAIMVGHKIAESGKLDGTDFESASHYLTMTFADPQADAVTTSADSESTLPALPFAITSFGAARSGSAIYVYGGHTGDAHSYSNLAQSNKLLKLDLQHAQTGWQEVAEGERLQGLGMVAYGDQIILVGGFSAMNAEGEEHDLHSQSSVRAFDLKTNSWSDLPSLPAARSSHDAAIVGNTLYVVGGWKMAGKEETVWHTTALAMDLSKAEPSWTEIAAPPFQRRAIATVAHDGKLFVIGGMTEDGAPTRAVDIYDPATEKWESVGELFGKAAMAGFGASGWSVDGKLVVTTYEGDVQTYDAASKNWKVLGQTADARFFHRLLPLRASELISIGGANMEIGKFLELEVVKTTF